jgi:predicted AAA+ superfamily ATPase
MRNALEATEFDILCFCAKSISLKTSPFTIYERLKQGRKISKDKLYRSFESLVNKNYIHLLEKFAHPKATKKVYLCDISLRSALSTQKHFGRLFENLVFLELLKSCTKCYYYEQIDFYLPETSEIILCKPFADERMLFKIVEDIEAFIFTHNIKKITAISMSKEVTISHPFSKVSMVPFDIWALGD